VQKAEGDNWDHYGPTVIVECTPLPLRDRAHLYRDGIQVVTPSVRRTPPEAQTPRAKSHNYLNRVMGDLEVRAQNPVAWAVLLDTHGNLCEGLGSNIFLVQGGALLTPREKFVLPGVSRATVIELAGKLGIPCREADLDLYDAYNADEAFITSTSLCICPVASVNGMAPAAGIYGPVTKRLIDAYVDLVDCDFVQQYLDRL
jgi:branched-chain amino acid aminotransferase